MSVSWYSDNLLQIGMSSKPLSYDSDSLNSSYNEQLKEIGAEKLVLVHQVHGHDIIEISSSELEVLCKQKVTMLGNADGILLHNYRELFAQRANIACGIRTADCLPIVIQSNHKLALLHAGWRGLSSRIVERTFEKINLASEDTSQIKIWIGAAAKSCCYEVGVEVCEALGFTDLDQKNDRSKIDLQALVEQRIRLIASDARIKTDQRCTICCDEFFSHRGRSEMGRNMMFVKF